MPVILFVPAQILGIAATVDEEMQPLGPMGQLW